MRKVIRTYALALSMVTILAAPAFAAPKTGSGPSDFFARLKHIVVRALDDAKIIFPVP